MMMRCRPFVAAKVSHTTSFGTTLSFDGLNPRPTGLFLMGEGELPSDQPIRLCVEPVDDGEAVQLTCTIVKRYRMSMTCPAGYGVLVDTRASDEAEHARYRVWANDLHRRRMVRPGPLD